MPDKYESQYEEQYGTSTGASVDLQVADLTVTSHVEVIYDPTELFVWLDFDTNNVELFWPAPTMPGATHTAIFRRSGTNLAPFTPTPETEHVRVPVGTTFYLDEDVPQGDYVYQVFPLVES